VSDDGRHVVIRPLAYVREADLAAYADWRGFPIIPCNLCGSQEHLKRREVATMLREWEKRHPGRVESIFHALGHATPSHLLDRRWFDFDALAPRPSTVALPDEGGDIAFDVDAELEASIEASSAFAPAGDEGDPAHILRVAPRRG